MKFRLNVHKMKCTRCDQITLIEEKKEHRPFWYNCPNCQDDMAFDHMGDITIVQEDGEE